MIMKAPEGEDFNKAAWEAFGAHQRNARRRGIAFEFSFEEWCEWWLTDDRWSRRGRGRDKLVMARKGDVGPYSPENVYCTTQQGNQQDVPQETRLAAAAKAGPKGAWTRKRNGTLLGRHLAVRGEKHPRSRQLKTPAGIFGSAVLASEHYGKPANWAGRQARRGVAGWEFIDP